MCIDFLKYDLYVHFEKFTLALNMLHIAFWNAHLL